MQTSGGLTYRLLGRKPAVFVRIKSLYELSNNLKASQNVGRR